MSIFINKIKLPVLQPNLEISQDREVQQVDILNGKKVSIMGRVGLLKISYNSFFPHSKASYCDGTPKKPMYYVSELEKIRDGENYCRVRVDEKKINKMCYIKSFSWSDDGVLGDIKYSIELEEYVKPQTILQIPVATNTTSDVQVQAYSGSLQGDQRESKDVEAQEYTVKAGDCLYAIARKFNMEWKTIYDDNKSKIGNDPNLIYAGQVLKIRGTKNNTKKVVKKLSNGRTFVVSE